MKVLTLSLTALLLLFGAGNVSAEPKESNRDRAIFQIVKATDDQVWRLNKQTGEMSVCTLDEGRLLCTSSLNATEVPKQTYAERQAAKKRKIAERKFQREEQRKKDLAFLDRVIEAVRSLVSASIENEQ